MDAVDRPRSITSKGGTDVVTETDLLSEERVVSAIRAAHPDHAILAEEGGVIGEPRSEYLWCIDPLDGTVNFSHGYPSFAVSVGVLHRSLPVAGCVVEFTGGPGNWGTRQYSASRHGGAYCDGRLLAVSDVKDLKRAILATGFGRQPAAVQDAGYALYKEASRQCQGVRRTGAAAVDLCHVAAGRAEGFWEYRLKPWDVCAGVLLVQEAGGTVTTMDGCAYSVFDRSVLACNYALYQQVLAFTEATTSQLLKEGEALGPWHVPQGYKVHAGAQN